MFFGVVDERETCVVDVTAGVEEAGFCSRFLGGILTVLGVYGLLVWRDCRCRGSFS